MLSPTDRSLYTDALVAPIGYRLTSAIATTFSLDPTLALTLPVSLAVRGFAGRAADAAAALGDPIALYDAIKRVSDRLTIYHQIGRISVPDAPHYPYGLLEPMLVGVGSPGRGVFHPKLWLMRFDVEDGAQPLLRLLVLSRNITRDRSWDLVLRLEGAPGEGLARRMRNSRR